ncbi:hypothetical protein KSS87_003377 [Heliosperma pusillum]|nr:hypothetical protein KSS87_003377 [Heliosperma pusillum]
MAIDNLPTSTSNESRLSGAYIRTLVKQLTTSKPTYHNDNNLLTNDSIVVGEYTQSNKLCNNKASESFGMAKPKNQNAQGHKKQVRRRLHTSRPYQERLLNMAEARKEIVTALKFHRAAMKQASEQQQQQQQQLDYQTPQQHSISRIHDCDLRNPKIESSNFTNTNNMVGYVPYYPSYYNNINNNNNNSYPLIEPSLLMHESLNMPLPNQTLGLNLNLQAFANLDTTFCHSINNTCSNFNYTSPSPMSPSSSSSSTPRDVIGTVSAEGAGVGVGPTVELMSDMHHPSLDEEEMAKIRLIGEQHQIEWDDTLDLVKSARWLKYIKSVEFGNKDIKGGEEINYSNNNHYSECPFEEIMELPPWLSANDQSLLQQHLQESCSEGTSLPWVDIGDIDGLDEEWLS